MTFNEKYFKFNKIYLFFLLFCTLNGCHKSTDVTVIDSVSVYFKAQTSGDSINMIITNGGFEIISCDTSQLSNLKMYSLRLPIGMEWTEAKNYFDKYPCVVNVAPILKVNQYELKIVAKSLK